MSYQTSIDWLWTNYDSPQQIQCEGFLIDGDNAPKLRGPATGQQCVINCIQAKRAGKESLAVNWLRAGQCHNDNARNEIAQNGAAAVDYAVATFGTKVP